ncbi:multiple sugar transport system substrate-binding protein [Clostridium saccharoperbutylacetonicum]|uniref:ABC-type sugar transport system, periplasmic component n=2 Tax=Clostridium TaxID=1485 RepID=M1N7M0_9CLOT|nr:sugar ABC transporter substrate-binding protein [Clostridium saccharoperbutylacetonicum]AGF59372.1 ABC-type sugar transport system, periplasmic component [Clostridium saccharoperbutylacetonicum N1-4(HMT)]NRT59837.1 multiple sugar transport system substrate-binding protein [Clostridium saccharoperbutylacetonicum]NSB23149.1 multiple sugar transport system substrate-binding protein [Clostridium saccharoperbutylacetonicum]NSB42520.1 multiple sugar transport system substrate-binding protein [Clos
MKKVLTKIMAAVLITTTVLSGCASKNENSNSNNEIKTLTVWAMGAEGELLDKMSEGFEKENPGIKVKVQALPWDQAHDKLMTAVASKSGPDVIQMGTSWVPEFAEAGALLDLSKYTDKYENLKKENYFESSLQTSVYKNEYVGVPWYIDTRVLFYRTDLLQGVGYPNGPSNWDEFKDAASKLTNKAQNKYGFLLDPKDQISMMLYAWQNGSEPITSDNVPHFNEPAFVDAVTYATSFIKEGYSPAQNDYDVTQGFKDGTFPMFISGPWMVDTIKKKATELDGKWAVRVLPSKKTNTSFVGGSNLSVFKSSKNSEEAIKYIDYMSKLDTEMKWFDVSNSLPARKDAWNTDKLKNDKLLKVFGEQMKDAKPAPAVKNWERIAQEVISSVEKIDLNGVDVKAELDNVNEKAKELLK